MVDRCGNLKHQSGILRLRYVLENILHMILLGGHETWIEWKETWDFNHE